MAPAHTTCSSCHCGGRRWIPGDELMPGEGIWVCGDCSFTANDFDDLAHHVYEVHPGTAV